MAERSRTLDAERQLARQPSREAPSRRAEPQARRLLPLLDAMTTVAGPQLVAAVAGERHGHVLARGLGDVIGGNGRRVGERLVQMPREPRQQLDDVVVARMDHLFMLFD